MTFDIDDMGNVSYSNSSGFGFDGQIDNSGKKPVLMLDAGDVTALEGAIETAVETVAGGGLDVTSVTVDTAKLKTKVAGKDKNGEVTGKVGLAAAFAAMSNQGPLSGKVGVGAKLSEGPLCTVCGKSFGGTEKFKQSLQGCGTLSGTGLASLDIAADVDEDGTSTFSYTDSSFAVVTGTLTQIGKSATCALDAGSLTAVEASLALLILNECGVAVTISVDEEACSGKPGRGGAGVRFGFGIDVTATGVGISAPGSSSTGGKFDQVP